MRASVVIAIVGRSDVGASFFISADDVYGDDGFGFVTPLVVRLPPMAGLGMVVFLVGADEDLDPGLLVGSDRT